MFSHYIKMTIHFVVRRLCSAFHWIRPDHCRHRPGTQQTLILSKASDHVRSPHSFKTSRCKRVNALTPRRKENSMSTQQLGFNAAILTRSKLNPVMNPASPTKEHNITRSVLSSISVYSGVKQGINCFNQSKGRSPGYIWPTLKLIIVQPYCSCKMFRKLYKTCRMHTLRSH